MKRWLPIVVVVGAILAGGAVGYVITKNSNQIDTIHDSAVAACRASTKPGGVRYILAHSIEDQLNLTQTLPLSDLFPAVPPETIKTLLRLSEQRGRSEIHQLLDVDCAEQYR